MSYNQVNISSGHSVNCRGARGYFDEVDEAIKVVDRVVELIKQCGKSAYKYHDKASVSLTNLQNIVNFHNKYKDGIDVSVHFNAFNGTANGVEVLHYGSSSQKVAEDMSRAIAKAGGFSNRGAKVNQGLYVLKHTNKPCILIEVCFCDSKKDAELYRKNFEAICRAICKVLIGVEPKAVETPKQETSQPKKGVYRVVCGSYADRENAEDMQRKLKEKGFDSFLIYFEG